MKSLVQFLDFDNFYDDLFYDLLTTVLLLFTMVVTAPLKAPTFIQKD